MSAKIDDREVQDQLRKLEALPDDQIDIVDIPEAPADAWVHARRPNLYRPMKQPVTLRLDADVLAWFKDRTDGRGYQTEINRVLRRYMTEAQS